MTFRKIVWFPSLSSLYQPAVKSPTFDIEPLSISISLVYYRVAVTHRLPPPDKCCVPFALQSAVKHIVHLSILLWSLAASINIFGPRSTKLLALRFETLLQAPVAYQRSIAHSGQLAPPPFPISFATVPN
ncbi:hypothetical protein CBS115989_4830 [Aspergillus niger]|nr:hypothetical protein CBS115989_4830 [Aspergillus niger]KAI2835877.1 hypothetical protein CBS11232_10347 [Aspergillus niger]KAI2882264.1 hypothetical protein CBS115988_191 [Aspergillus niger]KAI2892557.1 hypothetical protein CBS11852_5715 [Aspergillus niger]KAI2931518.1 hypothetical protein CBS147320_2658 [Aspergillus niger]